MLDRLRRKLSYANVVSSLALFIALGGSAYAVATGSISSREIRDSSIRSRDVRNNALTGRDINERSIQSAPRVYQRTSLTTVTLNPVASSTVSCATGDTALAGLQTVTGDKRNVRLDGGFRVPNGYVGYVTADPSAVGERRTFNVVVTCLARPRR